MTETSGSNRAEAPPWRSREPATVAGHLAARRVHARVLRAIGVLAVVLMAALLYHSVRSMSLLPEPASAFTFRV